MFSICIPVYNTKKYLAECVDSVLNQSYQNFEIILVDDGSTDESFKLCQGYEKKDSRITAFTKKNEGQLATRLFAINKAKGDFILCLDSDDYLDLKTLEVINNYFENDKCDVVYFRWRRVTDGRIVASDNRNVEENSFLCDKSTIYLKVVSDNYYNSMCLKAFRKRLLVEQKYENFYGTRFGEDLIQTLGILRQARGVLFSSHIFYNYRINPLSVSQSISLASYKEGEVVREYVRDFLIRENVFSKDDWDVYRTYCASLLFRDLMTIANMKARWLEKKEILDKKNRSSYFKCFLCNCKSSNNLKNVFLYLFKRRMFFALFILSRITNGVIVTKNFFKQV